MKEFSQAARKLVDINHWGMDAYCEPARIAEQLAEAMALGARATMRVCSLAAIDKIVEPESSDYKAVAAEAERLLEEKES